VNGTEVGFLDKGGGYLFLEACIRTQLRSAKDCGAKLKFGEKLVTFNSSAFGVTVTTDSGECYDADKLLLAVGPGPVAGLVGIERGVVSGVINLESSDVGASDRRPRHDEQYHEL
jgi:predicted flavoprotein YhiN